MNHGAKILLITAIAVSIMMMGYGSAYADYGFTASRVSDYGCNASNGSSTEEVKSDYGFIEASEHIDAMKINTTGQPPCYNGYYYGSYYNNGVYYYPNYNGPYYYPPGYHQKYHQNSGSVYINFTTSFK